MELELLRASFSFCLASFVLCNTLSIPLVDQARSLERAATSVGRPNRLSASISTNQTGQVY
jgi:hypothetical protein